MARTRLAQAQAEIAQQGASGLTTAEQIEVFLANRKAERAAEGLKIVTMCADGSLFTAYPKDEATKLRWLNGYALTGVTVVEC